jgi:hypothetical protein
LHAAALACCNELNPAKTKISAKKMIFEFFIGKFFWILNFFFHLVSKGFPKVRKKERIIQYFYEKLSVNEYSM